MNSEHNSKINYQSATYLMGAAALKQLPDDNGIEIAFAGRSNAGKSSALNRLTQQRNLARTSKTPGRTQLINLFELDGNRRLVDLPGYGFAKVSKQQKNAWQRTLSEYLQTRESLLGLVILMDIRHSCKDMDIAMVDWALQSGLSVQVLLSKSDKLKQGERSKAVKATKAKLEPLMVPNSDLNICCFSSLKGDGVTTLIEFLDRIYSQA